MFNEVLVRKSAPSVFSEVIDATLSDRYNLLRTCEVIEAFEESDWVTTYASQTGEDEINRHVVRMRQLEDVLCDRRDLCPELVISNSHNGKSALTINVGLYRKICSNGLVARFDAGSEIVRHSGKGSTMEAVLERGIWVVKKANEAIATSKQWSRLKLDHKQKDIFAKRISKEFVFDENAYSSDSLFSPKYDEPINLWTCFNMAQERLMRGGLVSNITGRVTRGRASATAEVNRNLKLWDLATDMVEVLS